MKEFAHLFTSLDQTNKTKDKIEALTVFFQSAPSQDKVWALALFTGRRPKRTVKTSLIRNWALEASNLPLWLFNESYQAAGDLADTISLILPESESSHEKTLTEWINFINDLGNLTDEEKKISILEAWKQLSKIEKFVWVKLVTGNFRIGVSLSLVIQALDKQLKIDRNIIAHRLMGDWDPFTVTFDDLIYNHSDNNDHSKPYPYCLAYALDENTLSKMGSPEEWSAEWKWDGIRSQLIKRNNEIFLWTRGEELVTKNFPEITNFASQVPDGTVLDGEILPYSENHPLPFGILQTRIGRKNLTEKVLKEAPVVFMAYDVLEWEGQDYRQEEFQQRRIVLRELKSKLNAAAFLFSPEVSFSSWEELKNLKDEARKFYAEGFMLKKKNSIYHVGRKRGDWFKWKADPFSADGVLVYAQKGHGKRAGLFTDYTFAVWENNELVPFAKAYSGLTDEEIREVDRYVKKNTKERFGPVRTVPPAMVFEIGFEGIQKSSRHKSGIAVRFPRILRWRKDKKASEADSLDNLKKLYDQYGSKESQD